MLFRLFSVVAVMAATLNAFTMPPIITEEPPQTTGGMTIMTEEPFDTTTPIIVTEEPLDTTTPIIVTEEPLDTTIPIIVTEEPLDTTTPIIVTEEPVDTTTPIIVTEEPVDTTTPTTTTTTTTTPVPTTTTMGTTTPTPCEQRMVDLAFLLDSSASEGRTNFQTQLDFVKNFVSHVNVGPSAMQVGLATFETNVHRQFYLNQYDDQASVISAVGQVPYHSGATYTQRALEYMRTSFFTTASGARAGVPKVLVLLTDGQSTSPTQTEREATLLKQSGVHVIAVGIGSSLGMAELRAIASNSESVITVSSFGALLSHIDAVKGSFCHYIGAQQQMTTPSSVTQNGNCGSKPADIVFVLDASYSEGSSNFQKQLHFVSNITSQIDVSPTQAQVSLLTFSTNVHNQFYLNAHTSKYSVLSALNHVPFQAGATYTGEALRFVRTNSLSTTHGRRPGSQPIVIVLTDGQSSDKSETVHEAALLKDTGALVIAVGIGSSADQYELRQIATDSAHVFTVQNFDFLSAIQQQILTEACAGLGPKPTVHASCSGKPADIVFLMDSSSSEATRDFSQMKQFVSNFAQQFQIGPQNVQISAISFSTTAHVAFYLNAYNSQGGLQNGIARISYYGGSTHTDLALSTARSAVLTAAHGARDDSTKTVILMTDGQSYNTRATTLQASLLKQQGATVITIGVGSSVNHDELESVATDVQHSFAVASFGALQTIEHELVAATCKACSGNEQADVLMILDASSDGGQGNFVREITFATKLLSDFVVGPDKVQFAVLTYASLPNAEFWFNSYTERREMVFAMQTLQPTSGSSNLGGALRFAREYAYAPFHGARADKDHYVVIVTDETSDNTNDTIDQANQLKQMGVSVMTVGVGDQVSKDELTAVASEPSDVFLVSDFNALHDLHKNVQTRICSDINSPSSSVTTTTLDPDLIG